MLAFASRGYDPSMLAGSGTAQSRDPLAQKPTSSKLRAGAPQLEPNSPIHEIARRAWLLALPLIGWVAYLALMQHWTGNPFEGFAAQKHWGVHSISNLFNVPKFIIGLFNPSEWHAFRGSLLDRCAFLLVLMCLPAIWRLGKDLLVWAYVLAVVPAMSGTFTSFSRFLAVAFPVFIALGADLLRPEWRWLRYALLALFAALHLLLVWRYVNCRWAG